MALDKKKVHGKCVWGGGGGLHCEKSSLRFEATNIHKMQLCTLHFFHVHYFIVLINLLSKATPRREEGEN